MLKEVAVGELSSMAMDDTLECRLRLIIDLQVNEKSYSILSRCLLSSEH